MDWAYETHEQPYKLHLGESYLPIGSLVTTALGALALHHLALVRSCKNSAQKPLHLYKPSFELMLCKRVMCNANNHSLLPHLPVSCSCSTSSLLDMTSYCDIGAKHPSDTKSKTDQINCWWLCSKFLYL